MSVFIDDATERPGYAAAQYQRDRAGADPPMIGQGSPTAPHQVLRGLIKKHNYALDVLRWTFERYRGGGVRLLGFRLVAGVRLAQPCSGRCVSRLLAGGV
jgi:hypothetical protein